MVDEEWPEALELARLSSKMSLWVSCRLFLHSQLTACPELVSDPSLLALTLIAVGFCPYLQRHKGPVILRSLSTVTQGELDLDPVTLLTNHAFFSFHFIALSLLEKFSLQRLLLGYRQCSGRCGTAPAADLAVQLVCGDAL